MTVTTLDKPDEHTVQVPRQLSLELTLRCQAQCTMCYNHSGPAGTDGEMTTEHWESVLDQAAELGVKSVQFIGGEPTLYRGEGGLARLIDHALNLDLGVEVFSNLIRIPEALWPALRHDKVTLATSYYSDTAAEHEEITKRRGSYEMTRSNIAKATSYGIPLRVGIIRSLEGQRIAEAREELIRLGVDPERIGGDGVRALGRAAGTAKAPGGGEGGPAGHLCGHCTRNRWAVLPSGEVTGCGMSRDVGSGGNVLRQSLRAILAGDSWAQLRATIPAPRGNCTPNEDSCAPSPGALPATSRAMACYPGQGPCSPDQDTCSPHSQSGVNGGPVTVQLTTRKGA